MDRITELLAQLNLFALAADSNEALTRIQSLFRGDERTREEFRAMLQELDKSPDSVSSYDRALSAEAALGLVCGGVFPVESEIELYERQLAIYSQTAPEAMDQTMPAVDLASVWREQGLEAPAAPRSWWWLDHVCLPSGRWMGFEVRSWVFWPHRAQR